MSGQVYNSDHQCRVTPLAGELIRSRQLLFGLVWKDIRVRYRYTAIGFLWAVLEPVALMLILTFVFSYVLADKASFANPEGDTPYAVFLLCGLVFWQFFSNALSNATQSLIESANLVRKVRFTREIIPLAAMGYPLVNLLIGVVLLIAIHLLLGGALTPAALWILPAFCIQLALLVGLGLILSCGNVRYRDVGYMVGVAILFGFYASPIFYGLDFVTDNESLPRWVAVAYQANPMAGLITAYRDALLYGQAPALAHLAWPALTAAAALVLGVLLFRRAAPTLSDHL
jgi:ABC-type polysaccharide/polyol phosphate export permease